MAHEIHQGMIPRDEYMLPHTVLMDTSHRGVTDRDLSPSANGIMAITSLSQKRPSSSASDIRDTKKHRTKSLHFTCTVVSCGEKFSTNEQLDTHMKLHVGVKPFTCEVCGKVCQTESKLKAHQASHATDGIKPVCDICERNFSSRSALNKHKKMLHKPKPHICPHCNSGFEERKYMIIHAKRAHDVDVPHEEMQSTSSITFDVSNFEATAGSNECKDLYKGNYSIPVETNTVHDTSMSNSSVETQKDHTLPSQTNNAALAKKGESNSHAVCATIACELCTSTFPSLAYLEQHMAVHVGEKNFTCHVCGMSFNGRIDLNSHVRLHTPENDCTNFGTNSYNSGNYNQFPTNQMHPGQGRGPQLFYRYACAVCSEQFLTLGSLKRHQAKGHNTAVLNI